MRVSLCFLLLTIFAGTAIVYAQSSGSTTASIIGVVRDEQGAAVANATVTGRQIETNLSRTVNTNSDGSYQIVQLPPGDYELVVMADGFSRQIKTTTLTIGTTVLADFAMTVGAATEIVEVTAEVSVGIEPDKTEKSNVIVKKAIDNLPINRRNFLDFTLTTSSVVRDRLPLQGTQATSGLNFNGQNARVNNVTIDGIDNNDNFSGAVRSTYSQEAVQEFQVISNSFSAEFGRAQGGVVNIVTRSGTNSYHGNLFFLNRNDELSARSAFAPVEAEFKQYQFGATLGGPIKKDRAFFFNSFERLTAADSLNVTISAPVVAALNRQGFPTRTGAVPFSETSSTFLTRADFKLNENDQITARYNFARNYDGRFEPFGGVRSETIGGLLRLRDDSVSVNNTYISTSLNLVNETRFLFSRRDLNLASLDPAGGPRLNIGTSNEGTVTVGRSTQLPSIREERIFQIVNNVSLTRGRNQLKFGVDYIHITLPEGTSMSPVGFGGQAFFTPNALGSTDPSIFFAGVQLFDPSLRTPAQQAFLASLSRALPMRFPGFPLLDLTKIPIPVQYIQGFGNPTLSLDSDYVSLFAQNDLRLNQRVLLKLGVRYDQERVEYIPKNRGNFSPRVAIALRLRENLNFTSSYGIFHGTTPFAQVFRLALDKVNGVKIPLIPFPFSILPYIQPGRKFPESLTIPAGIPFTPQIVSEADVQPDYRNGYTQQVYTGLTYALDDSTIFSAGYQYVRGIRLVNSRDINPVVRPIPGNPLLSRITGRINPKRGGVLELESNGDSYYNALTLEARRNFGRRVGFLASYTFSKTLDNFADYRIELTAFNDPLNLKGERGYSVQDVRNRFVLSARYDIGTVRNPILRDLQFTSIVTAESGRPYNILAGVDLNMNADIIPGDRPLGIARNQGITPGFATVDMRLSKRVTFKERYSAEFFFEGFNLFNRLNISVDFNSNTFPPAAGGKFNLPPQKDGRFILPRERFRNAFAPRQMQYGLKFNF